MVVRWVQQVAFVTAVVSAGANVASCAASADDGNEPETPLELVVANSFDQGGGYVWKDSTGTPEEIAHAGRVVLAKQPKGTYCSGFTFAVAMQTARRRGLLEGKSFAEVKAFQRHWYGATEEAAERQCAFAVEKLGIGVAVESVEDARPGDFVQLWRTNKSGHSVVLVAPVREQGRLTGLRYRSSQKSTDGIGDRTEFFSDVPGRQGRLDRRRIFVARLHQRPDRDD